MRRDNEVAFLILNTIEQKSPLNGMDYLELESWVTSPRGLDKGLSDFTYVFRLLLDAGYVSRQNGGVQLTWSGHDLLDLMRERQE